MGAERVIRNDGLRHEVGALRLKPRIEVLPEIAVGPAVKAALLHARHVVRNRSLPRKSRSLTVVQSSPLAGCQASPVRGCASLRRKFVGNGVSF